MPTIYETGHARNVANFQRLIEFVTRYGTNYNPSKNNLQLQALLELKIAADDVLLAVTDKNTFFNNKVNDRVSVFKDIRTHSTRLINALQATDATAETINDAKTFNKKIQGKRSSTPQMPADPNAPAPNSISSSQMSYDQLIQHFTGLKSVLQSETSYAPNETDLKVPTLEVKIADMTDKNRQVAAAYAQVSNARITRDNMLYKGEEALIETAADVKRYVKSVFGAASPQYDQVKGLQFRKIDNR